jgi:hypothetical protein
VQRVDRPRLATTAAATRRHDCFALAVGYAVASLRGGGLVC